MSISASEYEGLVAEVFQAYVLQGQGIVHRHRKYRGASGQQHDIDVSVEFMEQSPMRIKTIWFIECKWWSQKVGVQEVLVLDNRVKDVGAHKGIIVTNVGFQRGAKVFAESRGISLQIFDPGQNGRKVETVMHAYHPLLALLVGVGHLLLTNPALGLVIILLGLLGLAIYGIVSWIIS
jgi:hypothetical protein